VTVHNCLAAADELAADGIPARVIDLYSVKPVDVGTLRTACRETGGLFVVAEDHYPQGGMASAVLEALANDAERPRLAHCAVHGLPTSGTPSELMEAAGISANHIVAAARTLLSDRSETPDAGLPSGDPSRGRSES
jgi:transketolase